MVNGFVWQTEDGLPPPDSPVCGLFNELCPPEPYVGEYSRRSMS